MGPRCHIFQQWTTLQASQGLILRLVPQRASAAIGGQYRRATTESKTQLIWSIQNIKTKRNYFNRCCISSMALTQSHCNLNYLSLSSSSSSSTMSLVLVGPKCQLYSLSPSISVLCQMVQLPQLCAKWCSYLCSVPNGTVTSALCQMVQLPQLCVKWYSYLSPVPNGAVSAVCPHPSPLCRPPKSLISNSRNAIFLRYYT